MDKIDLKNIDLIVYDFDGVFTDNRVLVFEDGKEAVLCNRSDGLGVDRIRSAGVEQIILSTEKSCVVNCRAKKLGIGVMQGISDKKAVLINYCKEREYDVSRVIYFGNDVNDLEAMKEVGYPVAPNDAHEKVKDIAKFITEKRGGEGVVKEFVEKVLTIN